MMREQERCSIQKEAASRKELESENKHLLSSVHLLEASAIEHQEVIPGLLQTTQSKTEGRRQKRQKKKTSRRRR
jgi:hypothetical protein